MSLRIFPSLFRINYSACTTYFCFFRRLPEGGRRDASPSTCPYTLFVGRPTTLCRAVQGGARIRPPTLSLLRPPVPFFTTYTLIYAAFCFRSSHFSSPLPYGYLPCTPLLYYSPPSLPLHLSVGSTPLTVLHRTSAQTSR